MRQIYEVFCFPANEGMYIELHHKYKKSLKMQLRDFQAYDVISFISARFPKQQMLEEAAFLNRF